MNIVHKLARHYWGEEKVVTNVTALTGGTGSPEWPVIVKNGWRYHLQQLVISDHPIKYIRESRR